MRVLVVYHYYAHYRAPVLRELFGQGEHEYVFVTGDVSNKTGLCAMKSITLKDGSTCKFLTLRNIWFRYNLLWQSGLIKLLKNECYDAVIFLGSMNFLSTWLGCLIAKLKGKRVLMWTHGLYGNEIFLISKIRCIFYGLADVLLLYGEHAKKLLIDKNFDESSLKVIYNSLDVTKQDQIYRLFPSSTRHELLKAYFVNTDLPFLIFIGRLTAQKKLQLLVHAVAKLRSTHPVNLLFIGDGEERAKLEKIVADSRLGEYVHFYGVCYDDQISAEYLYHADICVAPGEVGLTAMHAMIYGTPVITHNDINNQMPEFEAIEQNVSGLLFDKDDVNSLISAIQSWLLSNQDREDLRQRCRKIILSNYNPKVQRCLIDEALNGSQNI